MTDILEYFKGKDRLENREEVLFKLIDELDKESCQLFSEIMDLSNESYYKIYNLYSRVKNIQKLYNETKESFSYVGKIELSSYDYAGRRFQLKRLLTAMATVYASMANVFLGIAAFVLLNQKASDDFIKELMDINDRMDKFDESQMERIGMTIDNCVRLLESKLYKMNEDGNLYNTINNMDLFITQVNSFIIGYVEGLIDYNTIESLSDKFKIEMIKILKNDLNSDSENLFELLEQTKKQNNEGLKLMKEYN